MANKYKAELTETHSTVIVMRDPNGKIMAEHLWTMAPGVKLFPNARKRNDWIELINAEAGKQIARAL